MGSFIIKASHVGTPSRSGTGYPGPATDEQMEIAKRAAEHTRKGWPSSKESNKKNGKPKPVKRTARSRKSSSRKKTPKKEARRTQLNEHNTERQAESTRAQQSRKLGISEAELERRVRALQQWHSEIAK